MAPREIDIPFGPDKTGGLGYGVAPDKAPEGAKMSDDARTLAPNASRTDQGASARISPQARLRTQASRGAQQPRSEQPVRDPFAASPAPAKLPSFASYDFDDEAVSEPVPAPAGVPSHVPTSAPAPTRAAKPAAAVSQLRAQDIPAITPDAVPPRATASPQGQDRPSPRDISAPAHNAFTSSNADGASPWELEPIDYPQQGSIAASSHDVQTSFVALRDSVSQSRELKAREKELEEFRDQLEHARDELADREDILANYERLTREQDRTIEEQSQARDDYKAELTRVMDDRERIAAELDEMRAVNDEELEPLQEDLGRARAVTDQAKNDERSRKAELSAAEAEMRRAGSGQDAVMAQARYDSVKLAYDKAASVSARAQAELDEVQRAYDDAMAEIEQMEAPLKHALDDLAQGEEELKELITRLGDELSSVRKRRQYCESVHLYPEETTKLRKAVEADEHELHEMELDCDELRSLLEHNKSQAFKAKVALGLGVLVIIAFVVFLFVLFARG